CDSESSPCKDCREKFSGEHGFGYECECNGEKESFFCENQKEVIEAIEMVSEWLGKVLGGLAGGVIVGFIVVILIGCGCIGCICFLCIKCCIRKCSDKQTNNYRMTPTNAPIYTRNDPDEKQRFISNNQVV
ncbi:unnamed protein product, partial [Brachionus calyciflorus]